MSTTFMLLMLSTFSMFLTTAAAAEPTGPYRSDARNVSVPTYSILHGIGTPLVPARASVEVQTLGYGHPDNVGRYTYESLDHVWFAYTMVAGMEVGYEGLGMWAEGEIYSWTWRLTIESNKRGLLLQIDAGGWYFGGEFGILKGTYTDVRNLYPPIWSGYIDGISAPISISIGEDITATLTAHVTGHYESWLGWLGYRGDFDWYLSASSTLVNYYPTKIVPT